jgi:hypothetical protein
MSITVFISKIDGEVFLKSNRPALVVSSTSWSALLNHAVIDIGFFVFIACDYRVNSSNMRKEINLLHIFLGRQMKISAYFWKQH